MFGYYHNNIIVIILIRISIKRPDCIEAGSLNKAQFYMVCVAEWPPFRKQLLTWLTLCSPRILPYILVISRLVLRTGAGF